MELPKTLFALTFMYNAHDYGYDGPSWNGCDLVEAIPFKEGVRVDVYDATPAFNGTIAFGVTIENMTVEMIVAVDDEIRRALNRAKREAGFRAKIAKMCFSDD